MRSKSIKANGLLLNRENIGAQPIQAILSIPLPAHQLYKALSVRHMRRQTGDHIAENSSL